MQRRLHECKENNLRQVHPHCHVFSASLLGAQPLGCHCGAGGGPHVAPDPSDPCPYSCQGDHCSQLTQLSQLLPSQWGSADGVVMCYCSFTDFQTRYSTDLQKIERFFPAWLKDFLSVSLRVSSQSSVTYGDCGQTQLELEKAFD